MVFGGGDFGGDEFEVVGVERQPAATPLSGPYVAWAVVAKRDASPSPGQYFLVMKCGSQTVTKPLTSGQRKGWKGSGAGVENLLKGSSGPLEVWVEKRRTQVATDGVVVSNRVVVR